MTRRLAQQMALVGLSHINMLVPVALYAIALPDYIQAVDQSRRHSYSVGIFENQKNNNHIEYSKPDWSILIHALHNTSLPWFSLRSVSYT